MTIPNLGAGRRGHNHERRQLGVRHFPPTGNAAVLVLQFPQVQPLHPRTVGAGGDDRQFRHGSSLGGGTLPAGATTIPDFDSTGTFLRLSRKSASRITSSIM